MEESRTNAESIATNLPAWDKAAALEVTGDSPDLARKLVQMLVRELSQELSDLRRCFQANDWPLPSTACAAREPAIAACAPSMPISRRWRVPTPAKEADGLGSHRD